MDLKALKKMMSNLRTMVIGAFILLIGASKLGLDDKIVDSIDSAATLLLGSYLVIIKDLANDEEEELIRAKVMAEFKQGIMVNDPVYKEPRQKENLISEDFNEL